MPGAGVEPTRPCGQRVLSPPCLPFHHPGRKLKKAWAGLEPAYKGFADPCLTSWLPRRTFFSRFLFAVLSLKIFLVLQPHFGYQIFYFQVKSKVYMILLILLCHYYGDQVVFVYLPYFQHKYFHLQCFSGYTQNSAYLKMVLSACGRSLVPTADLPKGDRRETAGRQDRDMPYHLATTPYPCYISKITRSPLSVSSPQASAPPIRVSSRLHPQQTLSWEPDGCA